MSSLRCDISKKRDALNKMINVELESKLVVMRRNWGKQLKGTVL